MSVDFLSILRENQTMDRACQEDKPSIVPTVELSESPILSQPQKVCVVQPTGCNVPAGGLSVEL